MNAIKKIGNRHNRSIPTRWRLLSILLMLCMTVSWLPMTVFADTGDVVIDETNFPDANFREYVKTAFDTNNDNMLTAAEIIVTTYIDCSERSIADLKGIEQFTALTFLNCSNNLLTKLDVSKNTALTNLECDNNQLANLDVSSNTKLDYLYCGKNLLTNLNVRSNKALSTLACYENQLKGLDVSSNTNLTVLFCYENQLTSLDVSKNTALTDLHCGNNQLTELDVSNNTLLAVLFCYENQLTSLDVSKNTALTNLECDNNQLTELDVSNNTLLAVLYCSDNQLTSLDVSNNTALTMLWCYNNRLTSLDVSNDTLLTVLDYSGNPIASGGNTQISQVPVENPVPVELPDLWKEFIKETTQQIAVAKEGEAITIKFDSFNCLPLSVMKQIAMRRDLTIKMEYSYKGTQYNVTFPAGMPINYQEDIPYYGPLKMADMAMRDGGSCTIK